jgi:hypothetical protein
MPSINTLTLALSCLIIVIEITLAIHFHIVVFGWISHHLWVVVIPFIKVIIKHTLAINFLTFLKTLGVFLWHCGKLVLVKLLKTFSLRYGLFFSQYRWRWIRHMKIMFIRKGKQFFRSLVRFWQHYSGIQQWIVFIAFFPIVVALCLLGLSFTITRKTMVQKTQEAAMIKVATSATQKSSGFTHIIATLDQKTLIKIKEIQLKRLKNTLSSTTKSI